MPRPLALPVLALLLTLAPAASTPLGAQMSLNVMDFGAVGDGIHDDTAAIEAALAAAPAKRYGWSDPAARRPEHATTIEFPSTSGHYRVTHTIDIPDSRNVRLLGPSSHSVRIRLDTSGDFPLFRVLGGVPASPGDGQRALIVEKIILHRGGIEFGGNNRRFHAIRDCVFNQVQGYAIRTTGRSVIDVEVSRCQFSECDGGISVAFPQSDLWVISHCGFVRNRGIDLHLRTSGVHVRDCDFEVRPTLNADQPHVHIEPADGFPPGGDLVFQNCRFGNEPNPPRATVVVGPLTGTASTTCGPVWFRDCVFRGAAKARPDANQGTTAVRLTMPVSGMHIEGCRFFPYRELIGEEYLDSSKRDPARTSAYNYWAHNLVAGPNAEGPVELFTHGGPGWILADADAQRLRPESPGRPTRNLLIRTDRIDEPQSWTQRGLKVVRIGPSPDLDFPTAYRISADGTASPYLLSPSTIPVRGPVVFSVWLRGGAGRFARLGIRSSRNRFESGSPDVPIRLTDRWERYSVVAPAMTVAPMSYQAWLGLGRSGDQHPGDIECAMPQLEEGFAPTPFVENPTASSGAREVPQQALVLGSRVVANGTAPPVSGYHAVGDMTLDLVPRTGQPIGWVCVEAGEPGIWRPFGRIE